MIASSTPSTNVDEHALTRLMVEFAYAADDADSIDAVSALFDTDGVLTVAGETYTGRAAIAAYLQGARDAGFAGPHAGTRHIVTNALATIESDSEASGTCEWMLLRSATAESPAPTVVASGQYRDQYRRTNGHWVIAARTVRS